MRASGVFHLLRRGVVIASIAAAVVGASSAAPARSAPRHAIKTLSRAGFLRPPAITFDDSIIHTQLRHLQDHGGTYTTPDGTAVRLYVSDSYLPDAAADQAFVNFVGSLVHGKELGLLTVDVRTPAEVQGVCGAEADACYDPNAEALIVPGQDPLDGTPVEQIVAHEYGHHIARNRSNPPWLAYNWGTKRWASYENVCLGVANHVLFPGDEGANYRRNPGEAFAETYRVLNADRAGTWGFLGWDIVDQSFYPDATALQLVSEDVLQPWSGPTRYVWRGRFSARGQLKLQRLPAYNDGIVTMTLNAPPGTRLGLFDRQNRLVAATTRSTSTVVCGRGDYAGLVAGRAGAFAATITVP
jgi:hypothetical protein